MMKDDYESKYSDTEASLVSNRSLEQWGIEVCMIVVVCTKTIEH